MKLIDLDARAKATPTTGAPSADPADDVTNSIRLLESTIKEVTSERQQEKTDTDEKQTDFLKFSQEDLLKMPKKFKKEFQFNGAIAHIRKNHNSYEIRYRRGGYNICVTAKTVEGAKYRFIHALATAKPVQKKKEEKEEKEPATFSEIAEYWLQKKKRIWTEAVYKNNVSKYRTYILPHFQDRKIKDIRPMELQDILDEIEDSGKTRTREDIRTLMKGIFDFAENNFFIDRNPINATTFKRFERKTKNCLSVQEEDFLIERLENDERFAKVKNDFYAMLFFGLRPCELDDARIEGDFLIARNRKRKNGKVEYKKIPFSERAKKYLKEATFSGYAVRTLNEDFQKIFPEYSQYCLRHTFATRCQMFVRQEIVNIWLGDAPDKLIGRHYTHFPDEFMLKEMDKVRY